MAAAIAPECRRNDASSGGENHAEKMEVIEREI
jgi:hypothetical protein